MAFRRALALALAVCGVAHGSHAGDADELRALREEVSAEREALAREREALAAEREALADQRLRVDDALAQLGRGDGGVIPASYAQPLPASPAQESRGRLDVYGYAMLDAMYDTNRVDPDWTGALRASKIPVNCGLAIDDPGCGENGETTLSARQSRLGVKGYFPTSYGELRTIFEFELFGVGDDAGETTFRLRHAWGELGALGAGQTWSVFMDPDVFPNTIEYWGPTGMAFLRNPQVRWTPVRTETTRFALAIEAPGSGLDQGKVPEAVPGFDSESWNRAPDFTSHLRYGGDWGHVQLGGILRFLGAEGTVDTTGDGVPDARFDEQDTGYGLNLTSVINVFERDQILAGVTWGEGIANYMNDGGSDLAPDASLTEAEALESLGFLLYYNRVWNDRWTSSIGYSQHEQDNSGGQAFDAFEAGRYASVNALFRPTPALMLGPEVIWAERENKNGDDADDTRLQVSFKYSFDGSIVGGER